MPKILGIILIAIAAIWLNHASLDIGWYSLENETQQEKLERGRSTHIGPFVGDIDLDGSVVPPSGLANDLRTWTIDAIVAAQSLLLVVLMKKYGAKKSTLT